MWRAQDAGLLGAAAAVGAFMVTLMKFWYSTIKERIDELKVDRDYWRRRARRLEDPTDYDN